MSLNTELMVDMSVRVVVTAKVILPGTRLLGIHRETRLTYITLSFTALKGTVKKNLPEQVGMMAGMSAPCSWSCSD